MKRNDLNQLQNLLTQILNRDVARLSALNGRVQDSEEKTAQISTQIRSEFPTNGSIGDLKLYGSWLDWTAVRKGQIAEELASLQDKIAEARGIVNRSLGRTEAIKVLSSRLSDEELHAHRRKAEQDGTMPDR